MEPRFGHDFSRVRVHADRRAAASARAVNAMAYTVGRNVVFADGRYSPATSAGRRLLAHELAHVIQQEGVSEGLDSHSGLAVAANDAAEEQADAAARAVQGSLGAQRPLGLPRVPARAVQREKEGNEGVQTAEDCASDCQSYCPDVARHYLIEHPFWNPISVPYSPCDVGPGRLWTCRVEATVADRDYPNSRYSYMVTVIWNGDGHRLRVHDGGNVTVYDYTCGDGLKLTRVSEYSNVDIPRNPYIRRASPGPKPKKRAP